MATIFPTRVRRDSDPRDAVMVLQQMLEFLRDAYDKFVGTLSRGTATVPATATSVSVAVSSSVGATYSVVVTPLADPAGRFWVSGKTASQFTINLQTAAPVGGLAFDWIAKGA